MKKFVENLEELMSDAGLKLQQLHDLTGIPTSTLGHVKKKNKPLPRKYRSALNEFFNGKVRYYSPEESVENLQSTNEADAVNELGGEYSVRLSIWKEADNVRLNALLREYVDEEDWGSVKEISTELLNRKITDKLKGTLL